MNCYTAFSLYFEFNLLHSTRENNDTILAIKTIQYVTFKTLSFPFTPLNILNSIKTADMIVSHVF